jgi:hypothetical protein
VHTVPCRRTGSAASKQFDRAELQAVEVNLALPVVPHAQTVVEVAGVEAVEVEDRPALENDAHLVTLRLDPGDVAESNHEAPFHLARTVPSCDLEREDLDPMALGRLLLRRHAAEPGVLTLHAVEGVAPERHLATASAQAPSVDRAVDRDDPAVEEPLAGLGRRSDFGGI